MTDPFGFTSISTEPADTSSQSDENAEAGTEQQISEDAGSISTSTEGSPTTDSDVSSGVADDSGQSGDVQNNEQEESATQESIKETIYVDPFADLGDTEKSIFESIKNKDYSSLKSILDAMTADYDGMSDIDLVRKQIKESKPRWSDEMIEAEMSRKYGIGLDDEEISPFDKLAYQMQLLDDGDAARLHFNNKKGEIKFPEITKPQSEVGATEPKQTPEEDEKFKTYWAGHIENSVKDLTDEVIKIEVGKDGSKETFDFPITITDTDKRGLKTLVSDFDISNDFKSRYVKDNVVDLKKFMSDRFKADNFDKLLKAAAAQGFSNGKLKQIAGDKNLDFENKPQGSGTHEQVDQRTNAAKAFFNNGR